MSQQTQNQQGFSTVELLISLFIAAAFIGTGFQLFSVITKDSNEARLRSKASNIAYENLRRYSGTVGTQCSPTPPSATPTPPSDLPNSSIQVTFSCPYGNSSKVTRVSVAVQYGQPQQIVRESLDAIDQ